MRILCLLLLLPAAIAAQAPTQPVKPATPVTRPATPAPRAAPRPAEPRPARATPPPAVTLTTDDQKTIYALGLFMQQSLTQFDLNAAELEILTRAIRDASAGTPAIKLDEWGPQIDPLVRARRERVAVRERAASVAFLAKATAAPGAVTTESGLIYRELSAGTGASPTAADTVRVHYRGTLVSGTEFDSSYSRNEPTEFQLSGVIPCWTEGMQRMKVGGKSRLVCP
ncbi:MAG: FKBP-type peptidyl-prolyl cis-trans isomerase, partial [Acidobacteriota bacterium]